MRNAADRKHVLQLSRQGCIRIRRITVVLLGFLSGLRTKESGIVGVLAMHQRDETQVTELLLATIRDGHFGGALQCQLSVIGLEGMRGQVFDQATALDPANGGTPAVCFESGCQACTQCVGRVYPQVLAVIGAIDVSPLTPLYAALALIVMIECVIAGRVIPAFTMSATPGLKLTVSVLVERAAMALTALALLLWVFAPAATAWNMGAGLALSLAAVAHVLRLLQWRPAITRHRPILWILHASYAWIPFGLGLLAAARFGWIANSIGVHALAIGATAGLIIGMITRTARGHTGRALQVSRPEATAYALVMLAAATRVLLPLAVPAWLPMALVVSATGWSVAFAIYLFIYTPWLFQTRLDGKDG